MLRWQLSQHISQRWPPSLGEQSWVSRDHGVEESGTLQLIWASNDSGAWCVGSEWLCLGKNSLRSESTQTHHSLARCVFVQVMGACGRGSISPLPSIQRLCGTTLQP